MQISVSGKQIDVGSSLREHVEENVEKSVEKYFENAINAEVVFSKESHLFCTDILINEGTGASITIKGRAKENDIYASFDAALERAEKQLRRYKRRIKSHRKRSHNFDEAALLGATKYVISENENSGEVEEGDNPLIIAEKATSIESLSVSEAVMRMNLADLPALMFINIKNNCLNVVYHRKDGNVSWVNTEIEQSSAA